MLKGKAIHLRPIEIKDATLLLLWENNLHNWRYSETIAPFSLAEISAFIERASDIHANKQLRMMICLNETDEAIGTIDFYAISFKHMHAGIGILIASDEHRGKGYAKESLELFIQYGREYLEIPNYFCSIIKSNTDSVKLFEAAGFKHVGTRKNWYKNGKNQEDELLYQKEFNPL